MNLHRVRFANGSLSEATFSTSSFSSKAAKILSKKVPYHVPDARNQVRRCAASIASRATCYTARTASSNGIKTISRYIA